MHLRSWLLRALVAGLWLPLTVALPAYAEQKPTPPQPPTGTPSAGALFGSTPPVLVEPRSGQVPAPLGQMTTASAPLPGSSQAARRGQAAVDVAMGFVGTRYRFGGMSPTTGFDCSGFVAFVFNKVGVALSRDLPLQAGAGRAVPRESLQPGDLLTFQNTYKPGLSHSGIYVGNGQFISAKDEARGVMVAALDNEYWRGRFVGARRLFE